MDELDDNRCENCIYGRGFPEYYYHERWNCPTQMLCKRFPPTNCEGSDRQLYPRHLIVYREDWCGEFARRLE